MSKSNMSSPGFLKDLCKNCTASWIDKYLSPRQTVNQIEACVMVAAAFLLILLVLGPMRRRSDSWIVQYGVMGAYILSFPLLSYILGLMQGIAKNELYPVWCAFIVLLFGGANSVSVHQLDDNKKWLQLTAQNGVYLFYVGMISRSLLLAPSGAGKGNYIRFGALLALFLLVSIKNVERLGALALASDARSSGSRTVFLHMKKLCRLRPAMAMDTETGTGTGTGTESDPRTMEGYKYLVLPMQVDIPDDYYSRAAAAAQEPNTSETQTNQDDKFITLDKIWRILSTAALSHLNDVCFSFALFRLALRRYFGYGCAESGLGTTHDLVFQRLLPKVDEAEVERVFHVIEVELGFLYDFFFTKHATTMCRGEIWSFALSIAITVFTLDIGTYALRHPTNRDHKFWDFGLVETKKQDIMVTRAIFCAIAVFLLVQYGLYCSSDWFKVSLVCRFVRNQGNENCKCYCFLKFVLSYMGEGKWFRRWQNKIGQYSFLDSFNHPCCRLEKLREFIHKFREGRKQGTSIAVPMEVKKAIALTLKNSNGLISNGVSSLSKHKVAAELDWACQTNREFTLAHVILIWHIATSRYEFSEKSEVGKTKAYIVANSLSKYCAYLVAFAPHLLPGRPLETESTLDELVKEARHTFKDASEEDIYTKLDELCGSNNPTEEGHGSNNPTEEGRGSNNPTEEGSGSSNPTEEVRGSNNPTDIEEGYGSNNPTEEGHRSNNPTEEGLGSNNPTEEGSGSSNPTEEVRGSSNPIDIEEGHGSSNPTEEVRGSSNPTEQVHGSNNPTDIEEGHGSSNPTEEVHSNNNPTDIEEGHGSSNPAEEAHDSSNPTEEGQGSNNLTEGRSSNNPTEEGMLTKASILVKDLKTMSLENRWELLADFWAEFMLYLSPSDNIAGHIESLAKGGEFVTHVWALLMHAGILQRPAATATAR